MSLQFFLIIGVFWILKPLKKSLFIEFYDHRTVDFGVFHFKAAQAELLAKNINMAVALGAMLFFIALSRLWRKHQLLTAVAVVLSVIAAILWGSNPHSEWFAWAFYVFGDLFNMLMLAAFFAYLNDSVSKEQAKRLFAVVILGGVAGGAFGSTITRGLLKLMSIHQWLLLCVAIIAGIVVLAHFSAAYLRRTPAEPQKKVRETGTGQGLSAAQIRTRSKYVLAIGLVAGCYEIVSTLVDYQFTAAVSHYLNGPAIGEYFSTVYMFVNILSVAVQLLATGFVMNRLGITSALIVLPTALLLGSLTFLALPLLVVGALLCIFDNSLNYSINQSARESLYVLIRSEFRYRAKAVIDIFVQRTAKALSVNLTLVLSAVLSFRWLAIVSTCFIVIWIAAALYAGRQYDNDGNTETPCPQRKSKSRLFKKPRLFPIVPL